MDAFDEDPFARPGPEAHAAPPLGGPAGARPEDDEDDEDQRLFDRYSAGERIPAGYQAYRQDEEQRRGRLTFAMAVLSGIRAAVGLTGILLAAQRAMIGSVDAWELNGVGTLLVVTIMLTVATFAYLADQRGAPALSLTADSVQLLVTVNSFIQASSFEGKQVAFVQLVILPGTSVVLAIRVLLSARTAAREELERGW